MSPRPRTAIRQHRALLLLRQLRRVHRQPTLYTSARQPRWRNKLCRKQPRLRLRPPRKLLTAICRRLICSQERPQRENCRTTALILAETAGGNAAYKVGTCTFRLLAPRGSGCADFRSSRSTQWYFALTSRTKQGPSAQELLEMTVQFDSNALDYEAGHRGGRAQ